VEKHIRWSTTRQCPRTYFVFALPTDIPINNYSMTAMFADDTAILATNEDQQTATD